MQKSAGRIMGLKMPIEPVPYKTLRKRLIFLWVQVMSQGGADRNSHQKNNVVLLECSRAAAQWQKNKTRKHNPNVLFIHFQRFLPWL